MFLVWSYSCLCPNHWIQVYSQEWRCSWSSADRQCSNYIWVINNFIAYNVHLILEVWQCFVFIGRSLFIFIFYHYMERYPCYFRVEEWYRMHVQHLYLNIYIYISAGTVMTTKLDRFSSKFLWLLIISNIFSLSNNPTIELQLGMDDEILTWDLMTLQKLISNCYDQDKQRIYHRTWTKWHWSVIWWALSGGKILANLLVY